MNVLLLTQSTLVTDLFREALTYLDSAPPRHTLTAVTSARDAWEVLMGVGDVSEPLPEVVFMDLDWSRPHNHDLLRLLKSDDQLKSVPVVAFAMAKTDEQEVLAVYDEQISCLAELPPEPLDQLRRIHSCLLFWSTCVTLPVRRSWFP